MELESIHPLRRLQEESKKNPSQHRGCLYHCDWFSATKGYCDWKRERRHVDQEAGENRKTRGALAWKRWKKEEKVRQKKNNPKQDNPENNGKIGDDDNDDEQKDLEDENENPADNSDDQSPAEEEKGGEIEAAAPGTGGGGGGKKKKKKKKSKTGNEKGGDGLASTGSTPMLSDDLDPLFGSMNLGPPSQQMYLYPPTYYPYPSYGLSYNTVHPSTTTLYYDPPANGYNTVNPSTTTLYYDPPTNVYSQSQVDPPSGPIHAFGNGYDGADDDYDDESGCSIM